MKQRRNNRRSLGPCVLTESWHSLKILLLEVGHAFDVLTLWRNSHLCRLPNTLLTGLLDSSSQAGLRVVVGNSQNRRLIGDAQASSVERMPSTSSTSSTSPTSSSPDRRVHSRQRPAGQPTVGLDRYLPLKVSSYTCPENRERVPPVRSDVEIVLPVRRLYSMWKPTIHSHDTAALSDERHSHEHHVRVHTGIYAA